MEGAAERAAAAEEVAAKGLSVRKTEQLAARLAEGVPEKKPRKSTSPDGIDYTREAEKALENALGRRVKITEGRKGGKIELDYYSADDREKLLKQLALLGGLKK